MVDIAVIDDHPIARYGVEHVVADAQDLTVVASVGSVAEFTRLLQSGGHADVIILDLYLNGDDAPSLAAVADLVTAGRVLIMSTSAKPSDVISAVRAGAAGYLTKRSPADLLISGIRTVAAGGFLLSAELADIVHDSLPSLQQKEPRLSPREEETLRLIACGLTHGQIATRLGVRKPTVDTYVERIRAKLNLGNKADLTRAALIRQGQIPEDPLHFP
ncbi:response regulator transcription factor [Nonomuraea sp. NPDC049419]|uniref:response regulator transcription factor n=1 Tax=unclassified Nonomuraea TaxID=2593643 RepID=UPI0034336D89